MLLIILFCSGNRMD